MSHSMYNTLQYMQYVENAIPILQYTFSSIVLLIYNSFVQYIYIFF